MSHLSSADIDPEYTNLQIKQFHNLLKIFKKNKINPKFTHIQNSAGIKYPCDFCNAVRVGISLYGEKPCENFPLDLEVIMTLKSKLISVKELKKDEKVSYCGTFQADKDMKIGVVSFGYADGLPRCLSNRGNLMINGQKFPIIGNITMDMTIVDITQNKNINVGDEVIIVGKYKNNEITFSEIAGICSTIPYEIMCGISKRVYRKSI
jgi:alanine racemase